VVRSTFNDSEKPSLRSSDSEQIGSNGFEVPAFGPRGKYHFKSYRLKGEYEQPWKEDPRMKRTRVNNWIIWTFILIGVLVSGYVCFSATKSVGNHPVSQYWRPYSSSSLTFVKYCLVYEDTFKTLDPNIWTHEVQIDGFGNGAFDWTTADPKNAYVDAEGLHIVPTLTNETTKFNNDLIYDGGKLNLTKAGGDGSCTGTDLVACAITSNSTLGKMIPPVRSARLTTKGKKSIRYGRVEVVAKMPTGDWLWPAIWMFPSDSVYGSWPRSGEIDIMESRGNEPEYGPGGRDVYTSTLHWGR